MSAPGTVGAARRGLIDATPLRAAAHDPFPQYHEIAAEARMTPGVVDSLGFEALGDIGPAPPEAPLSYYVEYGPDPREPERRLFIACSASLPKLPKPSQPPKSSKPRKPQPPKPPTLASVAKQAGKAGIDVARYEVKPDGTVVVVTGTGEQQQGNELDEWIAKHARAPERH